MLIKVTPSGTVGKQVYFTSGRTLTPISVKNVILTPSGANTFLKIRDGNASGEIVFFAKAMSAQGSKQFNVNHKFTKGMHVAVVGAVAEAYLDIT